MDEHEINLDKMTREEQLKLPSNELLLAIRSEFHTNRLTTAEEISELAARQERYEFINNKDREFLAEMKTFLREVKATIPLADLARIVELKTQAEILMTANGKLQEQLLKMPGEMLERVEKYIGAK